MDALLAAGNGTSDDGPRLQATIDDCKAAGGGAVVLHSGEFLVGSAIEVPQDVSLRGSGKTETTLRLTAPEARISFNRYDPEVIYGNRRGGSCSGFEIDGGGLATLCMDVQSVNREFRDFRVIDPAASGTALRCYAAQNCRFYSFDLAAPTGGGPSGTSGLVIDASSGGLSFDGFSTDEFTAAHVKIDQSLPAPVNDVGLAEPTHIRFTNFMIERGPSSTLLVWVRAGSDIWFEGGDLALLSPTATAPYEIVRVERSAASGSTRDVTFRDFVVNGTEPHARGFDLNGMGIYTRLDNGTFKNCGAGVSIDSGHYCRMERCTFPSTAIPSEGTGSPNLENVAAAVAMEIDEFIDCWNVIGFAAISTIAPTYAGHRITLRFTGTASVNVLGNIRLSNPSPPTAGSNDILSLICDGASWLETGRGVN